MGELFHACLERHAPPGKPLNLPALARRLGLAADLTRIEADARDLLTQPHLARFFDPTQYRRAFNELELLDSGGQVQRLDRVVEFDDAVWLLDYKSGEDSRVIREAELVARHHPQLARYRTLLAALYSDRPIHAALLLGDGRLVKVTTV